MASEISPPRRRKRAVFLLCRASETPLVASVASLFADERWRPWRGDVHKFGPHVTLRGIFSLQEDRRESWVQGLRDVATHHTRLALGPSRIVTRFPRGVALAFQTDPATAQRLKQLAIDVAEVTRPFIRWLPLAPSELADARVAIRDAAPPLRDTLLNRLMEIERLVSEGALPRLPASPEYRLPLLLTLWDDPARKQALFQWGDPFVHDYVPHMSLLALSDTHDGEPPLAEVVARTYPQLLGGAPEIHALHLVSESPQKAVTVAEQQPFSTHVTDVRRSVWQIEESLPLAD